MARKGWGNICCYLFLCIDKRTPDLIKRILTGSIQYFSSINNIFAEKVKGCNRIYKHLQYLFPLRFLRTVNTKYDDQITCYCSQIRRLLSFFSTAFSTYVMLGNTVSRTDLSHLLSCDYWSTALRASPYIPRGRTHNRLLLTQGQLSTSDFYHYHRQIIIRFSFHINIVFNEHSFWKMFWLWNAKDKTQALRKENILLMIKSYSSPDGNCNTTGCRKEAGE